MNNFISSLWWRSAPGGVAMMTLLVVLLVAAALTAAPTCKAELTMPAAKPAWCAGTSPSTVLYSHGNAMPWPKPAMNTAASNGGSSVPHATSAATPAYPAT